MGLRLTQGSLSSKRGLISFANSLSNNRASLYSTPQNKESLCDWCLLTPRPGRKDGPDGMLEKAHGAESHPSSRQAKVIPLQLSCLSLFPQGTLIKLGPFRAVTDGNERGGGEQQTGREGLLAWRGDSTYLG